MMSKLIIILSSALFTALHAAPQKDSMQEVLEIAHGVSVVQPYLTDAEYISYAMGIQRAATRYGIHPSILISITQQESNFRPNLPEGPAGEIGICQILKSWLHNPHFIREFGKMSVRELKKPATGFKVAAWILSDLKESDLTGPLPYWSFYNSRAFRPRLKYFLKVSKNLSALRKQAPAVYSEAVLVAASAQKQQNNRVPAQTTGSDLRKPASATTGTRGPREVFKEARLLHPKRMSRNTIRKSGSALLQTASLMGEIDYSGPVTD